MAGDGLALVFIVGVRSLGIDCRYRLDRPSLDLSAGVNLPPLSVPYQPLRPQMAVPKIVAVTDGQSLGVARVGPPEISVPASSPSAVSSMIASMSAWASLLAFSEGNPAASQAACIIFSA